MVCLGNYLFLGEDDDDDDERPTFAGGAFKGVVKMENLKLGDPSGRQINDQQPELSFGQSSNAWHGGIPSQQQQTGPTSVLKSTIDGFKSDNSSLARPPPGAVTRPLQGGIMGASQATLPPSVGRGQSVVMPPKDPATGKVSLGAMARAANAGVVAAPPPPKASIASTSSVHQYEDCEDFDTQSGVSAFII